VTVPNIFNISKYGESRILLKRKEMLLKSIKVWITSMRQSINGISIETGQLSGTAAYSPREGASKAKSASAP